MRYRYRYLDLIANQEVRELFNKRIESIREIRNFLVERGFYEVETPMIQTMAGGAAANPFKTHYQALGVDMFLRIAPELYLKRLLVGGFDRVFELNRNFRNEGLDRSHNPEFTMLEIYEAYGDVHSMMSLVQELITGVAQKVFGTLQVGLGEMAVDLNLPWRTVPYKELVREKAGQDWFELPVEQARVKARGMGLDIPAEWGGTEITQEVYEKLIEKTLINPTFVTRLPVDLVPLAKRCPDDPSVVDVFELVIRGREIAPGYTELNDPIDQRKRLEDQAKGDASKMDDDFMTALEHSMPPAGGMGIGIDRLIMVLTGVEAIRDVVLFPQLKPKS
ncbi:MAG: amino acid--tRNA ligase-related protein [Lentisphaerota bacterium]